MLEVLVALGVLALIGSLVFGAVDNGVKARDWLEAKGASEAGAQVALRRIARELELAWLTSHTQAVATYRTVFVARDEDPVDTIWFAALSHRPLYREKRESDQAEITIWGEDDPDTPGAHVLYHRESGRIDDQPDEGGAVEVLARGIKAFDLRFLDGTTNEWVEEWDSTGIEQTGRLPRAVQVVLTALVPDPEDEEELVEKAYTTTVLLAYAPAVTRSALAGP